MTTVLLIKLHLVRVRRRFVIAGMATMNVHAVWRRWYHTRGLVALVLHMHSLLLLLLQHLMLLKELWWHRKIRKRIYKALKAICGICSAQLSHLWLRISLIKWQHPRIVLHRGIHGSEAILLVQVCLSLRNAIESGEIEVPKFQEAREVVVGSGDNGRPTRGRVLVHFQDVVRRSIRQNWESTTTIMRSREMIWESLLQLIVCGNDVGYFEITVGSENQ